MYGGDLGKLFGAMLVLAGICGAVVMGICFWLIPWLWSLVKPWLHMVTG